MDYIKKYVFNRQFLYAFCFLGFMFIDWTRGSQVGSTWAWTVNMTGIVMAVILFSAYDLKEFTKSIYLIYSTVCIAALLLSYYWWNFHQMTIYRDKLLTAVFNIWLLGVLVIKMFLDVVVYKRRKLHFSGIEILAAAMLLWMLFSKNEDVWPAWYLVIFGLFYHTEYNREELRGMRRGMLNGIIAAFFLLQGAAFVVRPFDDPHQRYCGIYANCNINAMFYGIVWIAFLLKLFDVRRNGDKRWKEVILFIFAGVATAFSFLTVSKTAWVSMLVTGFLYIIFADFHFLEDKATKFIERLLLYVGVVLICIPVIYGLVRYLPPIFHHPVWYEGEYSEDRVHSWDPWDSEKYVSWDEFSEGIITRVMPFVKIIFGKYQPSATIVQASDGVTVGGTTYKWEDSVTQDFSSALGRMAYWEYYLKNGSMTGHSSLEGHDIGLGFYVWHAQNMFVQLWYYYGIPSAVLFLIVLIIIVFKGMRSVIKGDEEALTSLLYLVFFGIFGLFEATWYPGQLILLLAFFVPKYLIKPQKENILEDDCSMKERL